MSLPLSRRLLLAALTTLGAMAGAHAFAKSREAEGIALLFLQPLPGREGDVEPALTRFVEALCSQAPVLEASLFDVSPVRLRGGARALPPRLLAATIPSDDPARLFAQLSGVLGRIDFGGVRVFDPNESFMLLYARRGLWTAPTKEGDAYLQVVISQAMTGRDQEYLDWFAAHHGPELATVPGVFSVTLGADGSGQKLSGTPIEAPRYLSVMQFRTSDVQSFKTGLEAAAKTTITSGSAYDSARAWRETYVHRRSFRACGIGRSNSPSEKKT